LEFGNTNTDSSYKERNRLALLEFLIIIGVKYFDELAAIEYGVLKKDLKGSYNFLGSFDLLIAAHAKSLNMTLGTNNVREFERIQNLKIENWV